MQAARSLGKTLRAFQPTIRELSEVSNELKSTLQREIGLDGIQSELRRQPTAQERPEALSTLDSSMGMHTALPCVVYTSNGYIPSNVSFWVAHSTHVGGD